LGLYSTVFEVIDMRSFSNLWYWIGLAVAWSSASHWVIGVPYDSVQRARRTGGQAQTDLEELVRINSNRILYIVDVAGIWLLAFASAAFTALAILGFFYWVELAQAVFLLMFPMSLVGLINMSVARRIRAESVKGELLHKRLGRARLYTQIIGIVAVFITSMWGMFYAVYVGPLGG